MFTLTVVSFISIAVIGAVFYIECRIVQDLPNDNRFRKWWRKHVVGHSPIDL